VGAWECKGPAESGLVRTPLWDAAAFCEFKSRTDKVTASRRLCLCDSSTVLSGEEREIPSKSCELFELFPSVGQQTQMLLSKAER